MLKAVEITSVETLKMISGIVDLINETTEKCKKELPKTTYSKELIDILFIQPYTKIEFLVNANIAERRTASKYLKQLEEIGVLESFKSWKETIYVNKRKTLIRFHILRQILLRFWIRWEKLIGL